MPFLGKTPSQIVDPEVDIDGGTIDGVSIGSVTANAGAFTNLTATGTLTLPDDGISGDDVNGGTISNFASTGIDDNATSTAITIDSSQRVGIGVTPASIFNVGGSLIVDQSGDTVPFVKAFRATTGNNRPIFQTESSVGVTATFAGDGNTGLGIATPQEKLHVYTTADSRVEVESTTGLAAFKATNNQGSYAWYVDSSADKFHLYDFTDASNRLTLDGSGNFGIGTDAPNTYLSTISGSAKGLAIEGAVPVLALKDTSASDDVGYIYQSTNDMRMANYAGGAITFNIGSSFAERFSIESDGALHAKSSNTGTNPAANSHIASELRFFNTSATDNNLNAIGFYNSNELIDARIAAVHKSHSARQGELVFMTHNGSTLNEYLRIDTHGGLNIKSVAGAQAATFGGSNLVNGITALPSSAGTPFVVGRDTGTLRSAYFAGYLKFDSGYGIDFDVSGGSGVTVSSNVLDDYEEGTFTAYLGFSGGDSGGLNYTNQTFAYTKVGRLVTFTGFLTWNQNNFTSASGRMYLRGLPFTIINGGSYRGGAGIHYANSPWTNITVYQQEFRSEDGTTDMTFNFADATDGSIDSEITTYTRIALSGNFMVSGTYMTN